MYKLNKTTILLLVSLLFINIQSMWSQNIKSVLVEYQQKMPVNEDKIAHFPESMKEIVRAKAKWKPAVLVHNDKGSYYMLKDKVDPKTTETKSINATRKLTVKSGQKIYFKDFESDNFYTQYQMHDEVILIEDKLTKYKWKLESEVKTIDNIKCKKATTLDNKGRKVTVWYTDKFGINNGPGDYYGLPGLVVYAEGGTFSYKLSKVNFSDKEVELLKPDENAKKITPEEYAKLYVNSKTNETKEENKTTTRRSVKN
jgi:GLPGLI family protein